MHTGPASLSSLAPCLLSSQWLFGSWDLPILCPRGLCTRSSVGMPTAHLPHSASRLIVSGASSQGTWAFSWELRLPYTFHGTCTSHRAAVTVCAILIVLRSHSRCSAHADRVNGYAGVGAARQGREPVPTHSRGEEGLASLSYPKSRGHSSEAALHSARREANHRRNLTRKPRLSRPQQRLLIGSWTWCGQLQRQQTEP